MPEQAPRKRATGAFIHAVIPALLLALALAMALPIVIELVRSLAHGTGSVAELYLRWSRGTLLLRSVLVAGLIALLSVALAVPMARLLAARRSGRSGLLAGLLMAPIWLPTYMLYAAGNLLRAPDTVIGHAIIAFSTSAPQRRWVTIWVGYVVSVLALTVWSAPIAAVLIASGLGFRSNLYDEMLALEPVGRLGRARFWVRLHLRQLGRAWLLIAVIMMGSAIPLHLAQLDTWSTVIWRELIERGPDRWGPVWVSAIPPIGAGVLGAWVLTRAVTSERDRDDPGYTRPRAGWGVVTMALLVWALGVLLPLIAMLTSLSDPRALIQFWRLSADAVRDSSVLALCTGGVALLIALLTAYTMGHPSAAVRRAGTLSVLGLCVLGLIPGVLVGAAVARVGFFGIDINHGGGWAAAWLASCIRSSFIGAIIGALCAATESRDRRSARHQIAGPSLRAWAVAVLPGFALPICATMVIAGLYALHEIEAAVMVQPPGMDNLPQTLLSDLHYARMEELSAAGVNLLLIGIAVAIAGSLPLTRLMRPAPTPAP